MTSTDSRSGLIPADFFPRAKFVRIVNIAWRAVHNSICNIAIPLKGFLKARKDKVNVSTRASGCMPMGTRNISISDEAYAKLTARKGPKESFTDMINRLAGKKSVLDLAGVLSPKEATELRSNVRIIRSHSKTRRS